MPGYYESGKQYTLWKFLIDKSILKSCCNLQNLCYNIIRKGNRHRVVDQIG